jgi:hypothetical protein
MAQTNRNLSQLVDIMLTCNTNVCVTKGVARGVDSETVANTASELFPQSMERTLTGKAFRPKPRIEFCEDPLTAVVRITYARTRRNIRFDHELSGRWCFALPYD